MNGNTTTTCPEDILVRRDSSSTTTSSSEDDRCHIDQIDDDILETLDRKVCEVISRSRMNSNTASPGSNDISRSNSDKYGPLSFSYNKRQQQARKSPSPASARRTAATQMSSGMVRFGDDDADDDDDVQSESSSQGGEDVNDRVHWSDDSVVDQDPEQPPTPNPFHLRRKR
jgi:hypothetical protein